MAEKSGGGGRAGVLALPRGPFWSYRAFGRIAGFGRRSRSGRAGQSGEIALTSNPYRIFHLACAIAVLTLAPAAPARADFFDDARRTFTTDIPHFFQDDIPCAFGGRPTSGTRTSCKSSGHAAKHVTDKDRDRAAPPQKPEAPEPPSSGQTVPPSSSQ